MIPYLLVSVLLYPHLLDFRELERNREKINSSRTKVTDFVGMTDTARRMLVGMENRDTQQKMILGGIGIFLLIALILVIYFATKGQGQ